jgi:hypothetical protein
MISRVVQLAAMLLSFQMASAATPHAARGAASHPTSIFHLDVPAHAYDLILTRPEASSVTLSVLAYSDMEVRVSLGTSAGTYTVQTPARSLKKGEPAEILMDKLKPDTRYYYRLQSRVDPAAAFMASDEYAFHTARPAGSTYTFTLTADAHLDEHTTPEVYLKTLASIRAEQPDFHIDLGNLFMTDKHPTRDQAAKQYLAQRYYLGQIGPSIPVMLALGTHDGEASRYDDGTANCDFVWSNLIRKRYFPNPAPDDFFTGNKTPKPFCDLLEDYYAFTWGDALFLVLDPFSFSLRQGGASDGWAWSLGLPQYQWLKQTLEASHAKYKFIFIHNLLRGDAASRGGIEFAAFNEWGGKNEDGTDGFAQHRPGWDLPVHPLLLKNHVTAVFRAHDNFYARQELDGITYLMVPQPSFAGDDRIRDLENYGYKQGTFLGNSGYVRVTVSAEKTTTQYVRTAPGNPSADFHAMLVR